MKIVYFLGVFLFFAFVNAQASHIGLPKSGATIRRGRQLTVQIVRPNSIMGSTEVGIVIGLVACENRPCPGPTQVGSVLFNGKFDPKLHEIPGQPYQNFTVTVPDLDWMTGSAQLNVNRLHLIGAGPSAVLESNAVQVNIKK